MSTIYGQGPATLATGIDLAHDTEVGVTNPNLHRRINDEGAIIEGELKPRSYSVGIYGTHSYRTTTIYLHTDDNDDSEVP